MSCRTACDRSFTISAYEPSQGCVSLKRRKREMGRRRKDRPDPVLRRDVASLGDDRHDADPEAWPGRAAFQAFLQSGLEAIDQDAGRAEAGEFERRRSAELKYRAQRKAFEVEPDRRDVFAEISAFRAAPVPGPAESKGTQPPAGAPACNPILTARVHFKTPLPSGERFACVFEMPTPISTRRRLFRFKIRIAERDLFRSSHPSSQT